MIAETALVSTCVACIAGIAWAVRQEGRITAHDQRFQMKEVLDNERHEDTKERLTRIERKLDSLNGKH